MGNGSGLIVIDTEQSNNKITVTDQSGYTTTYTTISGSFLQTMDWSPHPEFRGTAWADMTRLTKRERPVAALHTILLRLDVLKSFTQDDWDNVMRKSIKRLKKAKWARNLQQKQKTK